jgi:hypothetical protein
LPYNDEDEVSPTSEVRILCAPSSVATLATLLFDVTSTANSPATTFPSALEGDAGIVANANDDNGNEGVDVDVPSVVSVVGRSMSSILIVAVAGGEVDGVINDVGLTTTVVVATAAVPGDNGVGTVLEARLTARDGTGTGDDDALGPNGKLLLVVNGGGDDGTATPF